MDAAELIDELKRLHAQGKDIGQHLYLRRYERSRKHSAALMLAGMQGFREMFFRQPSGEETPPRYGAQTGRFAARRKNHS